MGGGGLGNLPYVLVFWNLLLVFPYEKRRSLGLDTRCGKPPHAGDPKHYESFGDLSVPTKCNMGRTWILCLVGDTLDEELW